MAATIGANQTPDAAGSKKKGASAMGKVEIGDRIGRLVVTELVKSGRGYRATCRCDCGRVVELVASKLRKRKHRGVTGSCGNRQCHRRYRNSDGSQKGWIHKGYRYIYVAERKKWIPEHRLVMENLLGRSLRKDEHVHHLNGNGLDNCSENLAIFDQSTHSRSHAYLIVEVARLTKENKWLREQLAVMTN